MSSIFEGNAMFNEPLDNWKVDNVTDMGMMFQGCTNFNQELNTWNVNNVVTFVDMFANTPSFLRDLHTWDIRPGINVYGIFYNSRMQQNKNYWPESIQNNEDLFDEEEDAAIEDEEAYEAFHEDPQNWDQRTVVYPPITGKAINRIKKIQITDDLSILDIIEGSIELNMVKQHMKDGNRILFKLDKICIVFEIDELEKLIDTNEGDGLVLFCKGIRSGHITEEDVNVTPIYFKLKTLGFYGGFIEASEIQEAINHAKRVKSKNNVYILEINKHINQPEATVSWRYFRKFDTRARSSTHCSPGSGGPVYNLSVASFTINDSSTPTNRMRPTTSLALPEPSMRITRSMTKKGKDIKKLGGGATHKKYKNVSSRRHTRHTKQRKRRKTHKFI
jgi:hypothetical protein